MITRFLHYFLFFYFILSMLPKRSQKYTIWSMYSSYIRNLWLLWTYLLCDYVRRIQYCFAKNQRIRFSIRFSPTINLHRTQKASIMERQFHSFLSSSIYLWELTITVMPACILTYSIHKHFRSHYGCCPDIINCSQRYFKYTQRPISRFHYLFTTETPRMLQEKLLSRILHKFSLRFHALSVRICMFLLLLKKCILFKEQQIFRFIILTAPIFCSFPFEDPAA